jgi:hypothetical protein
MPPRAPTTEELEVVYAELRRGTFPLSAASITRRLGWPSERVSLALLELWQRGRADVDVHEPYGWRPTA